MSRLFTCGLEEQAVAAWAGSAMWSGSSDAAGFSVVNSPVRSGIRAIEITTHSANVRGPWKSLSAAVNTGTFFTRFAFRKSTNPNAPNRIFIMTNNGFTTGLVRVDLDSAGQIVVTPLAGGGTISSSALSNNTYYVIELKVLLSATVGTVELRIDGVSIGSLSSINTLNGTTLQEFRFSVTTTSGVFPTYNYDDIAINDASGSFQNDWPGLGHIIMSKPGLDGSITWTPNVGSDNFANVDDLPATAADDDTTYNSSATANDEDRYAITPMPAEIGTDDIIVLVHVWTRIRGEGTTATRQCRSLLWDESLSQTVGPTTNQNDGTAYTNCAVTAGGSQALLYDAAGKTKANLDNFSIGAEPVTSHPTRLTAIWANIEWIEKPPASLVWAPSPMQALLVR